jgi:hypothetical protein
MYKYICGHVHISIMNGQMNVHSDNKELYIEVCFNQNRKINGLIFLSGNSEFSKSFIETTRRDLN